MLKIKMELVKVNKLMEKVEKDYLERKLTLREFEEKYDVLLTKKSELERKLAAA